VREAREGTTVTEINADGVRGEWVVADGADTSRRLLYLHGGGYEANSPPQYRDLTGRITQESGVVVLALDYRLAPEHPYPAAVDDAVAALAWMSENGPEGASAASKTFIGGDSAGGGLSLATMFRARDAEQRMPDGAVLISAWTDLSLTGESLTTRAEADPMITMPLIKRFIRHYIGDRDPREPEISPLYGDYSGLPPLLLHVGDSEVLLDDTLRVADKARKAGVPVEVEVFPHQIHIFHFFASIMPEVIPAIESIGAFIKKH